MVVVPSANHASISYSMNQVSELFGYVCKHCKDPRAMHVRPGLDGKWGICFISGCGCPGYEQDNLLYLEQVEKDNS